MHESSLVHFEFMKNFTDKVKIKMKPNEKRKPIKCFILQGSSCFFASGYN